MAENKDNIAKHPGGRPTVMTPEVLAKLEEVFAIGGTDMEAIFYADISKDALYDYQNKHPEFTERKEKLKERPILKARQTVMKSLDNPDTARWFLERKRKLEFSQRTETDLTSKGERIVIMPPEIINKNDISPSTINDSAGSSQIPSGISRETTGQDNTLGMGDVGQSNL